MLKQDTRWAERGIYSFDQAASLLGITPSMIHRWVYGTVRWQSAIIPERASSLEDLITFLDLIQSMAIRDIRQQRKISLQKIRKTVQVAHEHNIPYPFARRHTAYVFSNDVVLRLNDGRLLQATGKYRKQDLMEPIVSSYLADLSFSKKGLAESYVPMKSGFREVRLSPALNFGAPTIHPDGYTVETLVNAVCAEGGISEAANVCNVNPAAIKLAISYENKHAA